MRRIVASLFVSAVALVACTSPCQNLNNSNTTVTSKFSGCAGDGGTFASTFDLSTCNSNIGKCSAADDTVLNAEADCLNALPSCTPDTEQAFITALADCGNTASSKLSSACASGVGGSPDAG